VVLKPGWLFLHAMLLCADYDVIVLSEPWLYKEINDNELGLFPNYSFFPL